MDYGKLFSRSANIVWQNKFLIVLGILASLTSFNPGGGDNASGGNGQTFGQPEQFTDIQAEFAALAAGVVIAIICVVVVIALILWAISTIARGGMVAGVDRIESGEKVSFSQAWSAGWQKAWTLLGIGFVPALPGLILFVLGLVSLGAYGGLTALFGEEFASGGSLAGLAAPFAVVACILVPIALALAILRNFAERAAMLENLGIVDSYRRGASVLMANLGEAIILFLLQIVLFVVLGLLLFVPGFIIFVCCLCFTWPLLIVLNGFISAFLSALWTLAWRTWTGRPPIAEKTPAAV